MNANRMRQAHLADSLEAAVSMLRSGDIVGGKTLVDSVHRDMQVHWCDACNGYTELTHHDDEANRELCDDCHRRYCVNEALLT